ncbi:hypothetical protein HanIR_Chr07g0339001 [Helianthus annuus]|nr:hypothetical protein HanIR_Chr07g0339001 [Helianthus annuus]
MKYKKSNVTIYVAHSSNYAFNFITITIKKVVILWSSCWSFILSRVHIPSLNLVKKKRGQNVPAKPTTNIRI